VVPIPTCSPTKLKSVDRPILIFGITLQLSYIYHSSETS
jgi:hypothetical protein